MNGNFTMFTSNLIIMNVHFNWIVLSACDFKEKERSWSCDVKHECWLEGRKVWLFYTTDERCHVIQRMNFGWWKVWNFIFMILEHRVLQSDHPWSASFYILVTTHKYKAIMASIFVRLLKKHNERKKGAYYSYVADSNAANVRF